jgi:hypothetical protein
MKKSKTSMAQQIAQAAIAFEQRLTSPGSRPPPWRSWKVVAGCDDEM